MINKQEEYILSIIDFKKRKHRTLDNLKCLQKRNKSSIAGEIKRFFETRLIDTGTFWQFVNINKNRPYQPDFYHIMVAYNPELRAHLHFILHIKFGQRAANIDAMPDNFKFSELKSKGHFVENANSINEIEKILERYQIPFLRGQI